MPAWASSEDRDFTMTASSGSGPHRLTLETLRQTSQAEADAKPHLADLRNFNHFLVGELNKCYALPGRALLDLGASIHGYALEAALDHGVSLYEGIDLDVVRHWGASPVEFAGADGRTGRLRQMNAEHLDFPDAAFDCLMSISTFEHFHHPDVVLAEMFRVLRPGGVALVTTEPIWTGSYGHHLHHFGAVSDLIPPWGHLFLSRDQMAAVLDRQPWPADAPVTRADALRWIYDGGDINRHGINRLKAFFADSPFETDWLVPLIDPVPPERAAVADYLSKVLPYRAEDLLTRGLSLLLRKR